ncbi:MAG: hypothetical protein QW035_04690 [Candidatus Anstonellales archaeon]
MSTEPVNILALVLGFLALVITIYLSIRTERLIQSEDEKAKALIKETQRMIDEGKKETQRLIEEGNARTERLIDEGRKETRELISYMVKILEGMEKRAEERHKELIMR